MDTNGKLFAAKLEDLRSGVEREDQGRAIENIGLGWSDKSKYNQIRAEWVDKK